MNLDWRKAPSVTPGGKPFFWVAFTSRGRVTVVWNRAAKQWAAYVGNQGSEKPLGFFATVPKAKRAIEDSFTTIPAVPIESPKQPTQSPMIERYYRIKAELPQDVILFIRLGDFYEAFGKDAEIAAKVCRIALTKRAGVPMAGIPYHATHSYFQALLEAGHRVAVCEEGTAVTHITKNL